MGMLVDFICRTYETQPRGSWNALETMIFEMERIVDSRLRPERKHQMAYKKFNKDNWTFARYDLSEQEKKDFTAQLEKGETDFEELLGVALDDGYKFSASPVPKDSMVIATLTGVDPDSPNYQCSMSARHVDFAQAMALILYKHFIVFKQGVWVSTDREEMWG